MTAKILQFPTVRTAKQVQKVADDRLRESIQKINELMTELKEQANKGGK
jgi:hypothetical protein